MKWIDVKDELPEIGEEVLVCVKYAGSKEYCWTDSYRNDPANENPNYPSYKEPNSKVSWSMGSATNYRITHWAEVVLPRAHR